MKSQCPSLLFVSTLGNFLYFSSLMYTKILTNNKWAVWGELEKTKGQDVEDFSLGLSASVSLACFLNNAQGWLFRAIWLFPYLFRALRLKLIWGMQK